MNAIVESRGEGDPLVSVIVPAWNAEATIAQTLRSAADQTYGNLEILIVDDGSADATASIAEHFSASEPRARLIRKENGGVASARNRGIAEAKGEWLAPLDADDLWHPTKIQKQVMAAKQAPRTPGFVYCWRRLIDRDGRVVASGLRCAFEGSAFTRLGYINAVECGSSLFIAREAALAVGGYDETLRASHAQGCEDLLLQLKLARRFPVAVVPEHLVGWRLHDRNMSSDFDQMARSCDLVFERLIAEGAPVPRRVVRWVTARNAFDIAEQRATGRKFGSMLRWLSRSILLDPVRCGLLLAYRAARSAVRRTAKVRPPLPHPRFQDSDPAAIIETDAYELRAFSRLLQKIDGRRMSGLAAEETAVRSPLDVAQPLSVG